MTKAKVEKVAGSVAPAAKVDPERQARWDAFLAKAEAQNPRQFKIDHENGEHETIPDSFI